MQAVQATAKSEYIFPATFLEAFPRRFHHSSSRSIASRLGKLAFPSCTHSRQIHFASAASQTTQNSILWPPETTDEQFAQYQSFVVVLGLLTDLTVTPVLTRRCASVPEIKNSRRTFSLGYVPRRTTYHPFRTELALSPRVLWLHNVS